MEYVGARNQAFNLRINVVLWLEDYVFSPNVHRFVLVNTQLVVAVLLDNLESWGVHYGHNIGYIPNMLFRSSPVYCSGSSWVLLLGALFGGDSWTKITIIHGT